MVNMAKQKAGVDPLVPLRSLVSWWAISSADAGGQWDYMSLMRGKASRALNPAHSCGFSDHL